MLRITGGVLRGRAIQAPPHDRTRPTQSKLRQALFNSLQTVTPGARVLDLFAGSGALGFEALSRGAEEVVFVEISRTVAKLIHRNAEALGVTSQVKVLIEPVDSGVAHLKKLGPFDLILADPPYGKNWETLLLSTWPWEDLLSSQGHFCVEWATSKSNLLPEKFEFLEKVREKKYGDSVLTTYLRC